MRAVSGGTGWEIRTILLGSAAWKYVRLLPSREPLPTVELMLQDCRTGQKGSQCQINIPFSATPVPSTLLMG